MQTWTASVSKGITNQSLLYSSIAASQENANPDFFTTDSFISTVAIDLSFNDLEGSIDAIAGYKNIQCK